MRPGVHDFIRGIWPIREGFYMVQILTPTMEFLAWQQGGREGAPPPPPPPPPPPRPRGGRGGAPPPPTDPRVLESRFQFLWIVNGAVTRTAEIHGPHDLDFLSPDRQGGFISSWMFEAVLRTKVRVEVVR